jgi:hypothetical protein
MSTIRTLGDSVADGTLPGSGTPIPIARGGTGSTTASAARTALGLGTVATYNVGSASGEIPTNASLLGVVPVGAIIPYWGADGSWPTNYKKCDGTSGTPDLRNLTLVGAGGLYAFGATGGAVTKLSDSAGSHSHGGSVAAGGDHSHGGTTGSTTLTGDQIPSHTHTITHGNTSGGGASNVGGGSSGTDAAYTTTNATGGGQGHTHSLASSGTHQHAISSDGGHQHTLDVMQPYAALWFLMRAS